jgi:multiple sugar transport system permease protein
MNDRTFWGFVGPSLFMMVLFIAGPLVGVLVQSFQQQRADFETVERESCTPFGCTTETTAVPITDDAGRIVTRTVWVGWDNYSALLDPDAVRAALARPGDALRQLAQIRFWDALRFTLTFAVVTLPLVIVLGLLLALAVNTLTDALKGPTIFVTLLPFIITPVIGALAVRWLFIGDGILTAGLERLLARDVAMFAQGWTIETMMLGYRVWHVVPFAFVIFYAGLQTVAAERLEAAGIDGATRWQKLRHVIVPHLMPLIIFVSLIHLMDSYRVFDEIIGFSASGYRTSLQYLTYEFLVPDESGNRSIGRASASAVLTMIGVVVLLVPLLRTTWKEQRRA